ncbi:MAG: hypothetical protein IKC87_01390 [Clostridia bacterium]|nr:hypothetical protein [Clostridia bacterium]
MKSEITRIRLSGDWTLDYLGKEPFSGEAEPEFEGFPIKGAIPAYWEDMLDEFRKSKLHTKLSYNPLYTLQRYPQAGYVPDMALPNVIGSFAYKRSFVLSDIPECDTYLYVGGAHNTLSAWINGRYLGIHRGYSSHFTLDIPRGVLKLGENIVTLVVSNNRQSGYMARPVSGCTSRAANECTGGIYGDVDICFAEDGIRDVKINCSKSLDSFTVSTIGKATSDAKVRIKDCKSVIKEAMLPLGTSSVSFDTNGMELWSPDSPNRYEVEIITDKGSIVKKFGLRRLISEGTRLYLNGEPFMFRAICEHGYYPVTVHPTSDRAYYRAVIRRLKELGFNAIRFHTWVPVEQYLDAADELGILIEVETPNNTTYEEWCDIVAFTSLYTSVVMYSSGNEMVIDEDYIEHLCACAKLVHTSTDSLFSPMSAMRGIEYHSWGECKVEEPFPHNPVRLKALGEFCDVYNSYSRAKTSYRSDGGEAAYLDECNAIYAKPLLSHEICINGTYIDLSLARRYNGTRIGDTELFSSVEKHLTEKGLIDRAPLYYKNSAAWQQLMRKHCFELCRRTDSFAGYDFLGDIDHHWHTFGYCVGMMNEFYELKPGETVQNVRRYNSDTVLLADLPRSVNFLSGAKLEIPILVSHYAKALDKATLNIRVSDEKGVLLRREIRVSNIKSGAITELYKLAFTLPRYEKPMALKLSVSLSGGNTDAENEWELYAFPNVKCTMPQKKAERDGGLIVREDMTVDELLRYMKEGRRVLLLSAGPFTRLNNSFQISVAGRTEGHLATAIADHPLMKDFPHKGFCSWQFREMMTESHSAALDLPSADFAPIIEIASSYKNARREALIFEYAIGKGKLLVSTLNLGDDPCAKWLKARLIEYASGEEFLPQVSLSFSELISLCEMAPLDSGENSNVAQNMNDITMIATTVK